MSSGPGRWEGRKAPIGDVDRGSAGPGNIICRARAPRGRPLYVVDRAAWRPPLPSRRWPRAQARRERRRMAAAEIVNEGPRSASRGGRAGSPSASRGSAPSNMRCRGRAPYPMPPHGALLCTLSVLFAEGVARPYHGERRGGGAYLTLPGQCSGAVPAELQCVYLGGSRCGARYQYRLCATCLHRRRILEPRTVDDYSFTLDLIHDDDGRHLNVAHSLECEGPSSSAFRKRLTPPLGPSPVPISPHPTHPRHGTSDPSPRQPLAGRAALRLWIALGET